MLLRTCVNFCMDIYSHFIYGDFVVQISIFMQTNLISFLLPLDFEVLYIMVKDKFTMFFLAFHGFI